MLSRLIPWELLKHHWTSLKDRSGAPGTEKWDKPVIVVLVTVPVSAAVLGWWRDVELQSAGALLSALSLLSAGLLAAFGLIATIRGKYRLPESDYDPDLRTREMLDEAVAHTLTASLVSVLAAGLIAATLAFSRTTTDGLPTWASGLVLGLGAYLFLVFLIVVRQLWGAYEVANQRDQHDGYIRR